MPSSRRGVQRRLFRLAGDERVVALVRSLDQARAAAAGDDRDALDALRPLREDERCASRRLLEPSRRARRSSSGSREARRLHRCPRTSPSRSAPRQAGEQRVVAHLGVRVEREVVRGERQVRREQRLEPALQPPVDEQRLVAPEEAVVDEHELRAGRRRPARTARASSTRRTRSSTPRRRRRPAGPDGRTPETTRPRAARRRTR